MLNDTHIKLPCGCIPGMGFCAEGRRLWNEVDQAHEQLHNAPASDFGWLKLQEAQTNFYMHFRGGMKSGNTENQG